MVAAMPGPIDTSRGRRTRLLAVALLLGLPLTELYVLILVGDAIGAGPTVALVILAGVAGILVLRHAGAATGRRLRETLNRGELPVAAAFDGICVFLAGLLLIIPGFISDAVAVLLLIPPIRQGLRRLLGAFLAGKVETQVYARAKTLEGEYHEVHGTLPQSPGKDDRGGRGGDRPA
jgi:UPF0716 protein FxsA